MTTPLQLLPFEGRYVLETTPCPRCGGTGNFAQGSRVLGSKCFNCRGLGRKPSLAALDLFYRICERIGAPLSLSAREGRFEPKHLESIIAKEMRKGMSITPTRTNPLANRGNWPRTITTVEILQLGQRRLHLDDGSVIGVSEHHVFKRDLTKAEVRREQRFLARYVGRGVIDTKRKAS